MQPLAADAAGGLVSQRPEPRVAGAERLALTPMPALALMADGSVAVLAQCDGQRVLTQAFDGPGADSRPATAPLADFAARWSGPIRRGWRAALCQPSAVLSMA